MDGSRTILCIEDDNFITELYIRALNKKGFKVDSAVSGADGLKMAQENDYDIVLVDIMTPDMTGIEVLNILRDPDGTPIRGRIVVITNLDLNQETRSKMEEQADGYLIKAEITPSKLAEIVEQIYNDK